MNIYRGTAQTKAGRILLIVLVLPLVLPQGCKQEVSPETQVTVEASIRRKGRLPSTIVPTRC